MFIPTTEISFICDSSSSLRIDQSISVIHLIEKEYGIDKWINSRGKKEVIINKKSIRDEIEKAAKRHNRDMYDQGKIDTVWSVHSGKYQEDYLRISISCGKDHYYASDSFGVVISPNKPLPSREFVNAAICVTDPYKFFINIPNFQDDLEEKGIIYPDHLKRIRHRPLGLYWQNYFNTEVIDLLGGMDHCLQTPAFLVEPFHKGIFIQITEKPFEPGNEQQMQALLNAMQYLKIPQ